MPAGQPSTYSEELNKKAAEYVATCSNNSKSLPTIEGLALLLSVDDKTINYWTTVHPEFKKTIDDLKYKQKNQLMQGGLYESHKVNPIFSIFLLKANHGMRDIQQIEHTGKDGQSLFPTPIFAGSAAKTIEGEVILQDPKKQLDAPES